jgi:hypothetical protein
MMVPFFHSNLITQIPISKIYFKNCLIVIQIPVLPTNIADSNPSLPKTGVKQ